MRLLEKIIWILGGLIVVAMVLVMVYWKPSVISTDSLTVKDITNAPPPAPDQPDFSSPSSSSSGTGRSSSPRSSGSSNSKRSRPAPPKAKLQYPTRHQNYDYKAYQLDREFRDKYGDNYREVWEAMQKAEAQLVTKPDGSKAVRILSIDKGSVIDKLQFQTGDEIYAVNGYDFSEFGGSTSEMYQLGKEWHGKLREETNFQIEFVRNGVPQIQTYYIPK